MSRNILVILSDEHQARAMGCAGHPFVQTPNLDALAARGTRFEAAYTPSPICVPARASFATGRYAHETRLWDNAMPYTGEPRGWGHQLQDRGVRVESIGKLHYRSDDDPAGFDVEHIPMQVVGGHGMVWGSIRREDQRPPSRGRMLADYIGPGDSKYTQYDSAVTRRACDWLAEQGTRGDDTPWCLYVGLVAPHFPLVVPQAYVDLYPPEVLPEVKLHPSTGYRRHPWVEKQNAMMDTERQFRDADERLMAMRCYYGLTSFLDHNVGLILSALRNAGMEEDTLVVYSSDHGDNVGARGLWGKSQLYNESAQIPLVMAGPGVAPGLCRTPVNLVDLSQTLAEVFGGHLEGAPGRNLLEIAATGDDTDRPVFSEYHAAGAVSGAFMLRKGRWKYHYYVGFPPELFDLETDPEELRDLGTDPALAEVRAMMHAELCKIVDPDAADAQAFADQDAMIEAYGGRAVAATMGAPAATPPPEV
ncbi:MAG: sulfatase-like hydrolase/transferase [Rhodobacter sp.]|nr:sulfatase-like hydrolase/transferase [Paracoccaceae bacterium]MCC0077584.1 sulfatase-like hydrolase/transferase [Rhodobacter sp.]